MPCEKELEREIRIILQTMLKRAHFIKKLPFDEVALYNEQAGQAVFVKKLPLNLVEFMKQHGWLKFIDGVYRHTAAGQAWLSEFIYFVDLDAEQGAKTELLRRKTPNAMPRPADRSGLSAMAGLQADQDYAPLLKLYNRQRNIAHKYLNETHLRAGQKLFDQFVKANLRPNVTMNWENLQSVKQNHHMGLVQDGYSETTYIARRELYESLAHVGQEFAAILVEVCLFGNGLEATEKAMNWPARSAKLLLTMALDRLAEHYQLMPTNRPMNKYLAWLAVDMNTESKFLLDVG